MKGFLEFLLESERWIDPYTGKEMTLNSTSIAQMVSDKINDLIQSQNSRIDERVISAESGTVTKLKGNLILNLNDNKKINCILSFDNAPIVDNKIRIHINYYDKLKESDKHHFWIAWNKAINNIITINSVKSLLLQDRCVKGHAERTSFEERQSARAREEPVSAYRELSFLNEKTLKEIIAEDITREYNLKGGGMRISITAEDPVISKIYNHLSPCLKSSGENRTRPTMDQIMWSLFHVIKTENVSENNIWTYIYSRFQNYDFKKCYFEVNLNELNVIGALTADRNFPHFKIDYNSINKMVELIYG